MLISALLLIVLGIVAVYLGAANLYKYTWWSQNYGGDYTDSGMWTAESIRSYLMWGISFVVIGILGVISGLILWFKGLPAVAEDNRAYLRKILLPIAIIGFFAGAVVGGFMLLFVWLMYRDDRYDFFGLLLEDVTRAKRRGPAPMATPTADGRDMYASGYQQQSGLYSDDYAQAAYGGGAGAYSAGAGAAPAEPQPAPEPEPEPAPAAAPGTAPACKSCGKPTEWIEEYGRYYCYDCDAYV